MTLSLPDFTGQRQYHWLFLLLQWQSRNGSPVFCRRLTLGSHRLCWKTWKAMEFENFIFQALRVMKFNRGSLRAMEN